MTPWYPPPTPEALAKHWELLSESEKLCCLAWMRDTRGTVTAEQLKTLVELNKQEKV